MHIERLLDVRETQGDDLVIFEYFRTIGTCEWLNRKESFRQRREYLQPKLVWLHANLATGKSVRAAHVVSHPRDTNLEYSFLFFLFDGDGAKSILNHFQSLRARHVARMM